MPILSGGANATGATLITIPAGETWQGSLAISMGADANSSTVISVAGGGTGVSPVAGTVLLGAAVKIPLLGTGNNNANINTVYVTAGDADATLLVTYAGGGTPVLRASANGAY